MKKTKLTGNLLILSLLIASVACDQISKNIVREKVSYNEKIVVIDNFITLTKIENTGAFLSLGDSMPRVWYKILMIYIPLIVLGYALYYVLKRDNLSKLMRIAMTCVIAGGLGNVIDRFLYGSVTDFLFFDFYIFHTGIVNIADITLTTGFFILLYELGIKQQIAKHKNVPDKQ